VSSPAATGGAGTVFEQHVGAYWLAQLLVGGIPPILLEGTVAGVAFQTEHLGWRTDDFLITCEAGEVTVGRLAVQAKRTFTISASDDECKKTFSDFWTDFNAPRFSRDTDRFALVVQRGTETLLRHFGGLLDGARTACDGVDFEQRLATPGLMDQRSSRHCDEIRAIIRDIENRDVSAAEIWPLLRVLHVLALDLATATAQHEAMMKTLLASTARAGGPAAATTTWNELVVLAGTAIPQAGHFRRSELPEVMRHRHAAETGDHRRALDALRRHSGPVIGFIRSVIGSGLHLSRAALVQKTLEELEQHQVVLVSGPAGCGKSAIAKDAIAALSADSFTFAFRAEEFAQPHIDTTLEAAKVPVQAETLLQAILAAHGRKVVLVESVERLLEKSTRDAFDDLLRLAAADKTLRVVLTCREYSTTLVRDAFLDRAELRHVVVTVPELDDTELSAVQEGNPELARPLGHPVLRPLLRNPYILDKASRIPWPDKQSLPETEREFRALFWRQVVRADQHAAGSMPQRREDTLVQIALRRARALSMHVDSDDLDREAIDSLRYDGLVESPEDMPARVAPAHDVLEDWAILRWLLSRHAAGEEDFGRLSAEVGGYPAIRRSYRKWVAELIEAEPAAAERLFRAAVADDDSVSAQFRDDTLVSLLRAPSAPAILARLSSDLLRDDQQLLRRVIHLLRVACVAPFAGLPAGTQSGSILNVPDGTAWAAVLELVRDNLASLVNPDYALLVGLIDDWSRGVSWQQPYPPGADAAAAIAHWLLPHFDPYRDDDPGHKILKVIAKIPKADELRFAELLHEKEKRRRGDRTAREFRELVFSGLDGNFAARDVTDVVVEEALDYLLCHDSDLQDARYGGYSMELELHFGLKENIHLNSFPSSAIRGPWFALLSANAGKALEFFAKVFDHSAEWYVHPRVPDPLEEAFQIELTFGDGTTHKQWANFRLWCLYRGTSVGPDTLQSMLMALEQWLIGIAEAHEKLIDGVLLSILKRNESAAMTGVVASVANAFPLLCGETLLVLLSARDCIALDRARMVSESSSPSQIDLGLPAPAEHRIYREERKKADHLPHRKHDLEWAIANLQFGPLAARVHEIIDRHRAAMPLVAEQTDDDRVWRLALDRMDVRRYRMSDEEVVVRDPADGKSKTYLRLVMTEPDPDIKQMVDESAGRFAASSARLGLLTWALATFRREHGNYDPGAWREKLTQARADADTPADPRAPLSVHGAPGIVAATCIRDHWDEMSDDERTWCVERACTAVLEHAENWDEMQRMQRFEMMPDRSCAWVMAGLLGKKLTAAQRKSVERAFIAGLTHPTEEVQWYATWGVAEQLWSIGPALALRCVNAVAFEASILWEARHADEKRPYLERQYKDAGPKAATEVRSEFWKDRIPSDAYERLDVSDWPGTRADARALTILAKAPDQPATVTGFTRLAKVLVGWWDADDDRGRGHGRQRDYHAEAALRQRLEHFLLSTSETTARSIVEPILDAVDRNPREVHDIIQGLTSAEDGQVNTPQYWFLWKLFADRIRQAKWVKHLPGGRSMGDQAVAAIFLRNFWKEDARHWKSLEGYAQLLDQLFDDLPPSGAVLNDYVRFLYTIGSRSLPGAFVRIERSLRAGACRQMLIEENDTIFMLEVILQRNVYVRPLELKSTPAVRNAILSILDLLVDNGSSAAFRMRDDFVTPVARSQSSTDERD
jgi:MoxR-like ATPase